MVLAHSLALFGHCSAASGWLLVVTPRPLAKLCSQLPALLEFDFILVALLPAMQTPAALQCSAGCRLRQSPLVTTWLSSRMGRWVGGAGHTGFVLPSLHGRGPCTSAHTCKCGPPERLLHPSNPTALQGIDSKVAGMDASSPSRCAAPLLSSVQGERPAV